MVDSVVAAADVGVTAKQARRARKRLLKRRERCEGCGELAPAGGNHDTAWSANGVTWEGIAVVAFCQWCGHEVCS